MKKIFALLLAGCLCCGVAFTAPDGFNQFSTNNVAGVTNTLTQTDVSGYLYSIKVIIPAGATQVVDIVTADENLLTVTNITGTSLYKPRLTSVHTTLGVVQSLTNACFERIMMMSDTVTTTITSAQATTNNVTIKFKFDNAR